MQITVVSLPFGCPLFFRMIGGTEISIYIYTENEEKGTKIVSRL